MAMIRWRRSRRPGSGYDDDMAVHMEKIWRWRCEDLAVMEMMKTGGGDGKESVLCMPMTWWPDD